MTLRLLEKLRTHAVNRPQALAIRQVIPDTGKTVTWGELASQTFIIAKTFANILPPGSVVMLCAPNRPEFTATFLGVLAAGMHVFPVAPDIAMPELLSAAGRVGAGALIVVGHLDLPIHASFARTRIMGECAADALLHDMPVWPTRQFDGSGLLLLSSGTTGQPKIVRRDASSLDAVSQNMVNAIGFVQSDAVLAAVPLCHSYGMEHGLLCPIWSGASAHLYDRFDLLAASTELARGAVTVFPGVPFMFEMLAGNAVDAPPAPLKLRRAYSAGGPLPMSLFDAFVGKFNVPVSQLYGATEIGSVTFSDPAVSPFDPTSVGRAMDGVSIKILDPAHPQIEHPLPPGEQGHVAIRATSMLAEYIDGEPPPILDGYFLTGDLGHCDETGALVISGRIKLLIDVAGRKVNPLEVERVLASHPLVGECVVVPMRVSQTLSRLRAVFTPAKPGRPPSVSELRQFAREHLSGYKVPRVFEMREALPHSAAGKLLRHLVEAEEKTEHHGDTEARRDFRPGNAR